METYEVTFIVVVDSESHDDAVKDAKGLIANPHWPVTKVIQLSGTEENPT